MLITGMWLSFAAAWAQGATPTISVRLCHDDIDSYPWLLKDRPGLNVLLLRAVETQAAVRFELQSAPWRRCLHYLQTGAVDGVFAASYSPERARIGRFPMAGERPDATRAMMLDSYSLYRLRSSAVAWDGRTLRVDGLVGAQQGYSIVEQLKELGVEVDDGATAAERNLQKLAAGRVAATALLTLEADRLIRADAVWREIIEKISPVLIEKPYFLIFSRSFFARHEVVAEEIWRRIRSVRESADYRAQVASFR